jgi:hypothetical protein
MYETILTIVLLVAGFSGCGSVIPYYGVTMNQKLLTNGVVRHAILTQHKPLRGKYHSVKCLNATITTTTLLPNGEKFTTTLVFLSRTIKHKYEK